MSTTRSRGAGGEHDLDASRLREEVETLEATEAAEAEWIDEVLQFSDRTIEFSEQCTPGYYNNEGQPDLKGRQGGFYFGGPTEFIEILEAWRADGEMKGLEQKRSEGGGPPGVEPNT